MFIMDETASGIKVTHCIQFIHYKKYLILNILTTLLGGTIKNGKPIGIGNIGFTRHWTKANKPKTQHRKLKRGATRTPPKIGSEPRCSRRVHSSCFLKDTRCVTHIVNTTKKNKAKTQHNMCWTSLCTSKHM